MDDLIKYLENESDTIYMLNGNNHGLVCVPKKLTNDIKVFMVFKNIINNDNIKQIISEMQQISKNININNNEGIFIVSLVRKDFINNQNLDTYKNEFIKIKKLVNNIYNKLLGEGKVKKENFIKKVELLNTDSNYDSFINWLSFQNPSKFHITNYQDLLNQKSLSDTKSHVFINNNTASIFNEPNRQSSMMAMQSNVKPINESLSIGTPRFDDTTSEGGPSNSFANTKTLVKKLPNNNHGSAAFIKWYTTLFILLMSLVIGISISVVLVK